MSEWWDADDYDHYSDADDHSSDAEDHSSDEDDYDQSYVRRYDVMADQLCDALDCILNYGDFACMTKYPQHVNPGLEVAGSIIPLPLVERDASIIKSKGDKAPSGRGNDTVAGVSGRKDWQIDFRCSNPAWPAFLDSILRETYQKLGINQYEAQALPSKLIISEEGSSLKLENDSEELQRNRIGTLVIFLPSKFEGGEVRLSHRGKCQTFASASCSGFELTVLAWYSDVTEEVAPITSGNRLMMAYNLMMPGGIYPPKAAANLEQRRTILQAALKVWADQLRADKSRADTKAIYMLDHKYSDPFLSIGKLRGRDPHIVHYLKQACREMGLCLLLVRVDITEVGRVDQYGMPGDNLNLDCISTVEEDKVARSAHVRSCRVLNHDYHKGRRMEGEAKSAFDDDEGTLLEDLNQHSALLVVSVEGIFDLIQSEQSSAVRLLRMVCLSTAISPGNATERNRREVVKFLDGLPEQFESTVVKEAHLLKLFLRACKVWSSQEPYDKAIRGAVIQARGGTHDDRPFRSTMGGVDFTIEDMAEMVAEIANEFMSSHTVQEGHECFGAFARTLRTGILDQSLDRVGEHLSEKLQQPFSCWRSSMSRSVVETKDSLTLPDLPFILELIRKSSDDDEWITTGFVAKLGRCADRYLLYSLLLSLSSEDSHLALESKTSLARQLLEAALPKLHLEIGDFVPRSQRPSGGTDYISISNGDKAGIGVQNGFLRLLRSCFKCGLEQQSTGLLSSSYKSLEEGITGTGRSGHDPKAVNREAATTFLRAFVKILHKHMETVSFVPPPYAKELFMLLFKNYIQRVHPGSPPGPRTTWRHKPRYCAMGAKCTYCIKIQEFLKGDKEWRNLRFSARVASHIEEMLPRQHYSCKKVEKREEGEMICILTVTKLGMESEYEEEKGEFDDKLRLYEEMLLPFRQSVVQRILGDETYKAMIMLGRVSGTKRAAGKNPDQPASTRQRTGDIAK